jgi:arylamine N-acetyltransferase
LKKEGGLINNDLELAESIILEAFMTEPFHTLAFLYDVSPQEENFGGTCSDKVLSVMKKLKREGFKVYIHSSFIGNIECHRLLRLIIGEQEYFADVGNGWPSIKLFPASKNMEYSCYGIYFESIVYNEYVEIYQTRVGIKKHTLTIPLKSKPETAIMKDISNRFNNLYPFTGKLRFAQIINDRFLFLRDSELHIYSESGKQTKIVNCIDNLNQILNVEFGFNLNDFICLKEDK